MRAEKNNIVNYIIILNVRFLGQKNKFFTYSYMYKETALVKI